MSYVSQYALMKVYINVFFPVIVMMTPIFAHDMSKVKLSQSQQQPPKCRAMAPWSLYDFAFCSFLRWCFLALLERNTLHDQWTLNTVVPPSMSRAKKIKRQVNSEAEESLSLTHYVSVPASSSITHTTYYIQVGKTSFSILETTPTQIQTGNVCFYLSRNILEYNIKKGDRERVLVVVTGSWLARKWCCTHGARPLFLFFSLSSLLTLKSLYYNIILWVCILCIPY